MLEGSGSLECQLDRLGLLDKIVLKQRGLGDPNVSTGNQKINVSEKVCTQEALGAVALDGVADFFAGDETDGVCLRVFAIKEDKIRRVPRRIGTLVDRIKTARVSDAIEML
jgi:hypothetical protein